MTEPAAEFIFGSWSAPQIALGIEYPLEVMDEIRAVATDGLQKLARGGLDVAGVLFGTRRESGIRILTWRPIQCEHALGPTLQLSEQDRTGLAGLLDAAARDPDLRGLLPVGWFLSHTRSGVLLAPSDLEIFNGFFPEPWQVALVLHPTQGGAATAGFFVRQADGALKSDSSYQEFTVKPLHRASRLADPPNSVVKDRLSSRSRSEAESATPIAVSSEPGRLSSVDPPLFRTLERASQPRHWLWMLPVILGLMIAGFLLKEKFLVPESQPFSLHVYDAGETVQIEWNQNAVPIRNAHLGAIDIKDGVETKRLALGDDELHAGKISYTRHGGDLELRMTVYPVGSNPVQEFAHFLDPGPIAQPAATSEVDQLRKQRDQLETEVKQLKEDLRKEQNLRRRRR